MSGADSGLLQDLRRFDPDGFALVQVAPSSARAGTAAVYAFNLEIAKIRDVVRDGLTGQFRLQWWRDGIEEIYDGAGPRRHPAAQAIAGAISRHALPRAAFDRLLEARAFDLEDRAPSSRDELLAYAGAVAAPLFTLAAHINGAPPSLDNAVAKAAEKAAQARVLAGLLTALPFHARQRRLMLPEDVCAETGLRAEVLLDRLKPVDGLRESVRLLAETSARLEREARALAFALPWPTRAAFLPLVLARDHLRALRSAEYNPFDVRVKTAQRFRYAKLAAASLLRRV